MTNANPIASLTGPRRLVGDAWSARRLIGPDAVEWLHGQTTQDVKSMAIGASRRACLCSPTGQIFAPLELTRDANGIVVRCSEALLARFLERFETMVVMEDVALEAAQEVFTVVGPGAENVARAAADSFGGRAGWAPTSRYGVEAADVWTAGRNAAWNALIEDLETIDARELEPFRIVALEPKWGVDYGDRSLPAELGEAFDAEHVSYSKGCYVGQEILMRLKSRGSIKKRLVGLRLAGPMDGGADVVADGSVIGSLSSVAEHPRWGWLGLATIPMAHANDGEKLACGTVFLSRLADV